MCATWKFKLIEKMLLKAKVVIKENVKISKYLNKQ